MIVAIDTGVNEAGVAVYEDTELTCAFLAQGDGIEATANAVLDALQERLPPRVTLYAKLVIEKPQVYRQHLLKGDPNDLLDVAMMGSHLAAKFVEKAVYYLPREWKGNMPKPVTQRLVRETLSIEEFERIEWPTRKNLRHNVYDAVGLVLFHTRRIRIKGLRTKG